MDANTIWPELGYGQLQLWLGDGEPSSEDLRGGDVLGLWRQAFGLPPSGRDAVFPLPGSISTVSAVVKPLRLGWCAERRPARLRGAP